MKTLVSNLFTKGISVKAVLYSANQYRSRMEINLHLFDCKNSKCWVIGSWGTTLPPQGAFKFQQMTLNKDSGSFQLPRHNLAHL